MQALGLLGTCNTLSSGSAMGCVTCGALGSQGRRVGSSARGQLGSSSGPLLSFQKGRVSARIFGHAWPAKCTFH
eukprot:8051060-Alexandrium_andersonii.AAC.1